MSRRPAEMVMERDEDGHETFIPRERWRKDVLEPSVRRDWNSPNRLVQILEECLEQRLFEEMIPIVDQLQTLEGWTPRAFILWVAARTETGRYAEAEMQCHAMRKRYPLDPHILDTLSAVCDHAGKLGEALDWGWKALQLDPNDLPHADHWISLHRRQGGQQAVDKAVAQLASLPNAWLPELWAQRDVLEKGHIEKALSVFRDVLKRSGNHSTAIAVISGELGVCGYPREMISLLSPIYDPEKHDFVTANNLLKAHLDVKDGEGFDRLRQRIEAAAPFLKQFGSFMKNNDGSRQN